MDILKDTSTKSGFGSYGKEGVLHLYLRQIYVRTHTHTEKVHEFFLIFLF